ncbi:MAG TPA: potassium channel family protein [Thermoanaerobaculia bacterium]|nr:potassium channel family protein [Thermoanaerobaculia bacterium]
MSERYRPLVIATILMFITFTIGVFGYLIIGGEEHGLIDAVYMTAITLTTVGFGEIIDMSRNPAGRLFTIALLFLGVGTFVYFFSALTAFIVEGNLEHLFWRRKMQKDIRSLDGHYVVCGGGFTGEHIVGELLATDRPFVLIESREERVRFLQMHFEANFPAIIGDATHDETLKEAGVERASGLFAAISSDKDNLIITISARLLNPKLRIICRSIDESVDRKMRTAGADVVVSPNLIGGLRMTAEMVRPTVVSFLDLMLRDREKRLRVEESTISASSSLAGLTAGEFRKRAPEDLLLLAIRSAAGEWVYNPRDAVPLQPETTLIYIGSPEVREQISRMAS